MAVKRKTQRMDIPVKIDECTILAARARVTSGPLRALPNMMITRLWNVSWLNVEVLITTKLKSLIFFLER